MVQRGSPAITPEKKLLVTLWFISHQDTIHRMSDRFNITDSSNLRCRNQVFSVMLPKKEVHFLPHDENVKNTIIGDFYTASNFPNVLGVIDGTHIRIVAPREHPQVYVNRKKFHSIILQGICAHNLQFLHVVAGWPGSVHDARVLRNSDVWNICPLWCGPNNHLLGNGAYPLQNWLLKPFRDNGHLTRIQIFHNICIINDDILDQYIIDGREEENPADPQLHHGEYDDEGGLEKQIRIANMF